MRIPLQDLRTNHPLLSLHPTDYHACGALAMQRAGHGCPREATVDHLGEAYTATIEWIEHDLTTLVALDTNRLTEDGAEAVALGYVHASAGWVVERRLQRKDSADWLMAQGDLAPALEVSGLADGDATARLKDKVAQVGQCIHGDERLAVVIQFKIPALLAGRP